MPDLTIVQHWTVPQVTEFCRDVLTIAAEGGIDHWARFSEVRGPDDYVDGLYDIWSWSGDEGEPDDLVATSIGISDIWATLSGIANRQYDSRVAELYLEWIKDDLEAKAVWNIDAECADIIVQLAIFGDLVYS